MRAGTVPYFSGRPAIDMLGKNDRYIARQAVALPPPSVREFRPGHMKFDFAHSIREGQPDVIVQLRQRTDLARPFLSGYEDRLLDGDCEYFRRSSPHVFWDRLTTRRCRETPGSQ
jgi:hypothetical protein